MIIALSSLADRPIKTQYVSYRYWYTTTKPVPSACTELARCQSSTLRMAVLWMRTFKAVVLYDAKIILLYTGEKVRVKFK